LTIAERADEILPSGSCSKIVPVTDRRQFPALRPLVRGHRIHFGVCAFVMGALFRQNGISEPIPDFERAGVM